MDCEAIALTAITASPAKHEADSAVVRIMATGTCLDCGDQNLLRYTLSLKLQSVRSVGVEKSKQGFAQKIKEDQFETLGPISFQKFLEAAMDSINRVDLQKWSEIQCQPSSSLSRHGSSSASL